MKKRTVNDSGMERKDVTSRRMEDSNNLEMRDMNGTTDRRMEEQKKAKEKARIVDRDIEKKVTNNMELETVWKE